MSRALIASTFLAAGLGLAAVGAADAHQRPDGPSGAGQAYCPAPPPPARIHHPRCPSRHAGLARGHFRRTPARAFAQRATTGEDDGVSASQALVYRRELAGDGWRGQGCCAGPDGWREDHGSRYERREFTERGGSVEGMRDGRRYGWSWRGDGDRGGPRAEGSAWRHGRGGGYEVYGYAGRDEHGYLVWADKPRR